MSRRSVSPVAATGVISVMTRIIEIAIYVWTDSSRAVRTYIAKPRPADGRSQGSTGRDMGCGGRWFGRSAVSSVESSGLRSNERLCGPMGKFW
jgi:hypothetical protein